MRFPPRKWAITQWLSGLARTSFSRIFSLLHSRQGSELQCSPSHSPGTFNFEEAERCQSCWRFPGFGHLYLLHDPGDDLRPHKSCWWKERCGVWRGWSWVPLVLFLFFFQNGVEHTLSMKDLCYIRWKQKIRFGPCRHSSFIQFTFPQREIEYWADPLKKKFILLYINKMSSL